MLMQIRPRLEAVFGLQPHGTELSQIARQRSRGAIGWAALYFSVWCNSHGGCGRGQPVAARHSSPEKARGRSGSLARSVGRTPSSALSGR